MNEIIEKTRELGEMIQASEEMKNVKNMEILQENDDKAQELFGADCRLCRGGSAGNKRRNFKN